MSGEPVVVVTDDAGAEFAAGVATATAEQAAETASSAEATAELALDVARHAADMASEALVETAEVELEDDMSQAELDAFKTETQGVLAAILERLDERDATAVPEDEPAGPPAPAPKADEGQDDAPKNDDGPAGSGTPEPKPRPKGRGYGARSWWGDDDE